MENNNVYSGSFFLSNNTSSSLNQVKIDLYVKKYISCRINATTGKNLAPYASLEIRKDVFMTNNDPNKKVEIKMEIKYIRDGNNINDTKVFIISN